MTDYTEFAYRYYLSRRIAARSLYNTRLDAIVLLYLDSTIEQTIRLRTNLLTPSMNDDDIERVLEERRRRALAQIAAMEAEESGGEPFKPN